MSLSNIVALEKYAERFCDTIPFTPTGRYVSIIMLRETKSYCIFTTEGGEQQDVEQTQAGLIHTEPIDRLVIFKRKQVAPERRTGKALLRQYGSFPFRVNNKEIEDCYLTAGLCTHCVDCLIYGYAAIEAEGARKARVMTDSCFSIRPYAIVTERKTFNVIDEKEQTSGTVTKYDYTKPQTLFPSVVTTVDLTLDEFVYVLTNILRTARYGKEVTRQGEMENHILSIAFSDAELFSNLEFTQAFYDVLLDDGADLTGSPLSLQQLLKHTPKVIKTLTEDISGRLTLVVGDAMIKSSSDSDLPDGWEAGLDEVLKQVRQLNQDEERLASFLKELNRQAASFTV